MEVYERKFLFVAGCQASQEFGEPPNTVERQTFKLAGRLDIPMFQVQRKQKFMRKRKVLSCVFQSYAVPKKRRTPAWSTLFLFVVRSSVYIIVLWPLLRYFIRCSLNENCLVLLPLKIYLVFRIESKQLANIKCQMANVKTYSYSRLLTLFIYNGHPWNTSVCEDFELMFLVDCFVVWKCFEWVNVCVVANSCFILQSWLLCAPPTILNLVLAPSVSDFTI